MCNCIKQLNEILAEKNTEFDLIFTLGKVQKEYLKISTIKINKKIRNGPVAMIPSYCPFCGKKYIKNKKFHKISN